MSPSPRANFFHERVQHKIELSIETLLYWGWLETCLTGRRGNESQTSIEFFISAALSVCVLFVVSLSLYSELFSLECSLIMQNKATPSPKCLFAMSSTMLRALLIEQPHKFWPFHWQFKTPLSTLKLYVIVCSWLYFRKIAANSNVIVWHSVDQKTQIQSLQPFKKVLRKW